MRPLLIGIALLSGCSDPCIEMCQEIEVYLDRCGYGWSTVFGDLGWSSIDDCYEDYWEADPDEYGFCQEQVAVVNDAACY
jgi:hypothetical protein